MAAIAGQTDARRDSALPISRQRDMRIGRRGGMSGYVVDLTAALEQLRAELRDEVLAELRNRPPAWPEWMSIATAAKYLDISAERLRKLTARGRVPYHQEAPGCRVLYGRADLDQWMGTLRHDSTTEDGT